MDQNLLDTILKLLISFFGKGDPETPITPPKPDVIAPSDLPQFTLIHKRFCPDGIFGELYRDGTLVAYTLEHSFDNKPKVVDGSYTCIRGPHRLHGMTEDFITFEIKNVPPFNGNPVTGILFHWGNYNKDSDGCVLLGSTTAPTMVGNSRQTWSNFMKSLEGFDSFGLTVKTEV